MWRQLNPDFEIIIWTDDLVRLEITSGALTIDKESQDLIFDATLNPGMRADILRLNILRSYKPTSQETHSRYIVNVYSDVDMACVKGLNEVVQQLIISA